jgi:hypothetical protein
MSDVNAKIRERIESFVAEIAELVRQSAIESVAEALGGSDLASLRDRHVGGLNRRLLDHRRGGKRSPQEIDATTGLVLDFVRQNPGQGVEQIAKSLGTDTRELTLPIKKLVGQGQLTTEGQKRATKYFAAGDEPKPAPAPRRPRPPRAKKARARRSKG